MLLAASGGFRTTVGGIRLSARSPVPVAAVAVAYGAAWLAAARRRNAVASDLEWAWAATERRSRVIIITITLSSALLSAVFETRSAAGADASGYLSEAAMLARGELFHQDDLFEIVAGHDPFLTSPLGWRPSPGGARQSPTYPPGLPMLMAVPHAMAGIDGASILVVVSGMVAVAATAAIAFRLAGATAAILAAMLIAFAPIFIHQSIQPMSDVPVTAAWMLCFFCAMTNRSLSAGVACAFAVLIRPNLAPLAIVPLVVVERRVAFAIPVAIAAAVLAALQSAWYGSPLRSGYGSTDELFAWSNIAGNVPRYASWFLSTAPALAMGLLGSVRLRTNRSAQALAVFAAMVIAAYLVYAVFDDWSYLRFLLPALGAFAVLAAVELAAWIDRSPIVMRPLLLFAVVAAVTTHAMWWMQRAGTFDLADQLRRVSQVAAVISDRTPAQSAIVSGEQSGAMRYYTHRPIIRWEAATASALTDAVAFLRKTNRPVFVVLDAWEEGPFRTKLGDALPLNWPPMLDAGTSHRTRVWALADRDRFRNGEHVDTVRIP